MSESSDGRRRVAEIHAAQRAAQVQRYRVSGGESVLDRGGEHDPVPEIEPCRVPWPAPLASAQAGPAPEASLLSSLRQAIAGETWQIAPRTAEPEPAPAGPPTTTRAEPPAEPRELAPAPLPLPGAPPRTPTDSHTRSNAAMVAFEAGLREAAPPSSRPASPPVELPRHEDPETLPAVEGDDAVRPELRTQEPMPAAAPSPARRPAERSVPKPADPMADEVAIAFDAGARETASLPAVPLPLPSGRHPEPRAPERQVPAGDAGQAQQMTSLPATSTAGQSVAPTPTRQPQPQPQPHESRPPQMAPRVAPAGPDDAARAFDTGAREVASLPVRPPAVRPRAEATIEAEGQERLEVHGEASSEEDAPEGSDALLAAQQALDERLAQLTFRGVVANGVG
ncbi:hypothetical protein [Rhizobacter sp. P5_C2]